MDTTYAPPRHSTSDAVDQQQQHLEEIFQRNQPTLTESKISGPPTRLSQFDRLRIENTSLKLLHIGHQLEKLLTDRARLSREFDALRQECFKTYGVDVAFTRIDEEGNFCGPLPQQPAVRT